MRREMQAVDRITKQCEAALKGAGPAVQGAVLADLAASFFAGHHPAVREEVIVAWLETMRALIAVHPFSEVWNRSGLPQ